MQQMTIDDLCSLGRRLTDYVGQTVWDLVVVAGDNNLMCGHLWTSQMSNHETWLPLAQGHEDYTWNVEERGVNEVRLYLPEGQSYSVESHRIKNEPSSNGVTSFWSLLCLPEHLWSAAPFVCPFCGTLSQGLTDACEHVLIVGGHLRQSLHYQLPRLKQLCDDLRNRTSLGDFGNVHLEGITVKRPREFWPRGNLPGTGEWFWTSYVYAQSMGAAIELEAVAVHQASCIIREIRTH